jgi:trehalose-phosphatase
MKSLLVDLSKNGKFVIGIVSGRGLRDLKSLVSIPGLIYAGNHGLEISGPGIEFAHSGVKLSAQALDEVQELLASALADVPGLTVEHKGMSLTVHFRGTPDRYNDSVDSTVVRVAGPFVRRGQVKITRGKKVVEVRPNLDWDKGKAIARIRESCPDRPLPMFFGDDQTDEDGFAVVQDLGGVAVFVGPPRTGTIALHQVESPDEVAVVLELLLGV